MNNRPALIIPEKPIKKSWISWKKFKKNKVIPKAHYCGEVNCDGACGVLYCGCIDMCRCSMRDI